MDTIEQRLTTDVEWAQAVVDLGDVIRHAELDGGRPVNLVRIGMVIDALSRYLVDGGAMLYGVIDRTMLSESALTAKERMVLSRWADDGLIEATPEVGDRVPEVADLSGLPVLTLRPFTGHVTTRFPWLADGSGRVLHVTVRAGVAHLSPLHEKTVDGEAPATVVGRAKVPRQRTADHEDAEQPESKDGEGSQTTQQPALPWPAEVLLGRTAARITRTVVTRHRFMRAEPTETVAKRQWRCPEEDCALFGERRSTGQSTLR